ncbi:uncharacterized protein LOC136075359 isoform X1 [Hydra vulgaris]|uniref:Uncharacterized protein LOC136075359 isoform X1 n=1 Tax=Hydra vulgaris TaxID=6087 RepID=A0ABM4B667_HYDVU
MKYKCTLASLTVKWFILGFISIINSTNVTTFSKKFSEITSINITTTPVKFSDITSNDVTTAPGIFSETLSSHVSTVSTKFSEITSNKSTLLSNNFTTSPNATVIITTITAVDESTLAVVLYVINDTSQGISTYAVECIDTLLLLERDTPPLNVSRLVFIFKDLLSNKVYFFRARAQNIVGPGPWSTKTFGKTKKADVDFYGPVQKYSFKPVQYKESTDLTIYWEAPLNAKKSKVFYRVLLCSLNIPCENFSSKTKKTSISFSGLIPNFLYQCTIFAYNQNDETNISLSSSFAYKTFNKDTCPVQYFTCRYSPGCILLNLCCNNIIDCVDGSDEQVEADCRLPPDVKGLKINEKSENSITIQFDAIDQPQERVLSYEIENINYNVKTLFQELRAYYPPIHVLFDNLNSGTFYSFRVRSRNLSGYSKWSILLNVTTTGVAATIADVSLPSQYSTHTLFDPTHVTTTNKGYASFTSDYVGSFHHKKSGWFSGQSIGVIVGIILVAGLIGAGLIWFYKKTTFPKKRVLNNDDNNLCLY